MQPGDAMIWRRPVGSGRYASTERVPCTVVAVGRIRVVVEVEENGRQVKRLARPEDLEQAP